MYIIMYEKTYDLQREKQAPRRIKADAKVKGTERNISPNVYRQIPPPGSSRTTHTQLHQ